jgi:hypothetical protein
MSDEAARGIDPRFDPRFQRGYTPDAATPAFAEPAPVVRAEPSAPERRIAPPAARISHEQHHADLLAEIGFAADSTDAHADRSMFAAGAASAPAPSSAEPAPPAGDAGHRPPAGAVAPTAPAAPASRHSVLRFSIALAASFVFVVIGAALYWNAMNEQMRPSGRFSVSDSLTQQMILALGTGLLQAGALGAIVVLAVWAVTGLRRAGA